jgi:hypothetical protein
MADADLRPMTIGEVLDRTFRLYKNSFWLFAGIMTLPYLVLFIFNTSLTWLNYSRLAAVSVGGAPHPPAGIPSGAVAAGLGIGLLVIVLTFVLTGIGQAATICAVSDLYLGRPATIRSSFTKIRGQILLVMGAIFLAGLLVGVGFILLIIPGIYLMCRTGVTIPVAVLENETPGTAISRSMDLTQGFAMQVFLIFLLTWVLAIVAGIIFQMPFTLLAAVPRPHVLPFGLAVLQQVANFIVQVIVAPIGVIALSLMYYNLRVRKEAFDLQHLMESMGSGSAPGAPAAGSALPA